MEQAPLLSSAYEEQQLKTFLQESMICHPNAITIFAPLSLIPVTAEVTWLDPSCHFWSNDSHYFSTVGFHDCGMKAVLSDESVTFENALVVNDVQTISPLVDFGESISFEIPVSCIYPRRENLTTSFYPLRQSRRVFVKRHGHLDMYMNQYSNAEFSQVSSQPVPLGSPVFIKFGVEQLNRSELAVMADRCIATPSYSPADTTFYSLIENNCPSSPMVNMYPSTQNEVTFNVRSFMFRSTVPSIVYVHCEVSVCHKSSPGCNRDCRQRRKREVSGKHSSHLLSTGPIYVMADKDSDEGTTGPIIAAVVFAGIAVVAVGIAIIGWRKRYSVAYRYSKIRQ